VAPAVAAPGGEAQDAPRATPTARSMAKAHDVNLGAVPGSGSAGRVMKQDVQQALGKPAPTGDSGIAPTRDRPIAPATRSTIAPTTASDVAPSERREERQRMSKRRQTIARRLVEAQRTAAMLTTFNEIDMSAVMALRARRKESFQKQYGVGLGIASFFVKASVAALRAFPLLNAEIQGDEIVVKRYFDIGMAVGAEGGLVVPVLRDADRMSFAQLELAIRDFAKRAADGTLTLEDLQGGTFTITNGGVYGSLLSTPILNPPQVGILGLHKIQERPVNVDGQIALRQMMYVALSYDHRIVDGREAVQFLVRIKELVEDPGNLLLEG
jgi:2-oxoglutarate dehydrogenase E2 component (dihydrolipoamide succinyltransferase)